MKQIMNIIAKYTGISGSVWFIKELISSTSKTSSSRFVMIIIAIAVCVLILSIPGIVIFAIYVKQTDNLGSILAGFAAVITAGAAYMVTKTVGQIMSEPKTTETPATEKQDTPAQ